MRKYKKIRLVICLMLGVLVFLSFELRLSHDRDNRPEAVSTPLPEENGQSLTLAPTEAPDVTEEFDMTRVPLYTGEPYVIIGDNVPDFSDMQGNPEEGSVAFEQYSELDALGRCGVARALLGQELMPTEERGEIGAIKPTGWHTIKYDCIEDRYLYNRCHLIGYQLSGENANEKNLITGTRYMNIDGMLPFENRVARYIRNTGNHVRYRVTPVFQGENLLATGVRMEAYSVEDEGAGICFDVFVYNAQPGIRIDYATGDSFME